MSRLKWEADSCIDSETRQPAALAYFQTLGVNPAEAVRLILATHWHDDHIRGLSQVVAECRKARFCCSAALTHTEFLATVLAYEQRSLPSPKDIQRIQTGTDRAYITAPLKTAATRTARPAPVLRTIRETAGQLRAAQPRTGWVRLRNGGCRQPDAWDIELSKDACHLSQLDSAQFLK